jgi:hypothetical protein
MKSFRPAWLAVSAWRINFLMKGIYRMFTFGKKKIVKERTIDDFKSDLSKLVSEAKAAGIHWRRLADALTSESDGLHQWHTLTSPLW